MRYQRAELHNHTTESDGSMTVEELVDWAEEKHYEVLALTDHNTCSGHGKAWEVIKNKHLSVDLLEGVEVTTFHGHILALGMNHMVDFTGFNPQNIDEYLRKLRRAGAAAIGIAHPFCLGRPVMAGCRFDMDIHDWSLVDYIEIFNTSAGADEKADKSTGNEKALELWEQKVLEGFSISAVTGKDIHKRPMDLPVMITYAVLDQEVENTEKAQAVLSAILEQKTIVTRGPLFKAYVKDGMLCLIFDHSNTYLGWNTRWETTEGILQIRTDTGEKAEYTVDFKNVKQIYPFPKTGTRAVLRLYEKDTDFSHLLAAGVKVSRKEEV